MQRAIDLIELMGDPYFAHHHVKTLLGSSELRGMELIYAKRLVQCFNKL